MMLRLKAGLALAALALALWAPESARAELVIALSNTTTLPPNDDSSVGPVNLGFTANFFGTSYDQAYVNNNGNLTFTGALSTFTPFNLYTSGIPIIAPFFADVDTRPQPGGGSVSYGSTTYDGHYAFGTTWNLVGYYSYQTDRLDTFQTLLVDRSDTGSGNFDIVFNYDQIQWDTGQVSNVSARAGYSNGTSDHSYELPGSAVSGAFLDSSSSTGLIHNSNVGILGRYVFEARNGGVEPSAVPEPSTLIYGATGGLLGLGLAWRERRRMARLAA
jgi:hypothetical protein